MFTSVNAAKALPGLVLESTSASSVQTSSKSVLAHPAGYFNVFGEIRNRPIDRAWHDKFGWVNVHVISWMDPSRWNRIVCRQFKSLKDAVCKTRSLRSRVTITSSFFPIKIQYGG